VRLADHRLRIDTRAVSVTWSEALPMQSWPAIMLVAALPALVAIALFIATLTMKPRHLRKA
jgi:hypothetical protein